MWPVELFQKSRGGREILEDSGEIVVVEMSVVNVLKGRISASRMTFLSIAVVVSIGNTLTGWGVISWVLWIPPIALSLAAMTGVCPFKILFEKMGFSKD